MKVGRRDFLRVGARTVLGGIAVYNLSPTLLRNPASLPPSQGAAPEGAASSQHYWRFVVNNKKCIGCGRCVRACKLENDVPFDPRYNRTWVERYVFTDIESVVVDSPNAGIDGFTGRDGTVKQEDLKGMKSFFVPKLCNHCDKPPCVQVCPVGATYINREGVVLVNRKACIGCRYCVQACPYGARFLDPRLNVVDKCTWCYHRITRGIPPACVEVCPVNARLFGDTRDPKNEVSKILMEEVVGILKPEIGCINKVYYVGLEKGVR